MDLHRVRRVAEVLVASQLRSGRSSSDPRSLFGRPLFVALVDFGAFLGAAAIVGVLLGPLPVSRALLVSTVNAFAPLLPLVAVAAVLVAGVMFELTATTKFSGSDAANWLPISPTEYVAASSSAIAYSYSPAIALFLGGFLPVALAAGLALTYTLAAALAVLGLFEGAVLVEMVRAVTQRTASVGTGRRGHATLILRAALLIVLILVFNLAFNPVFLLALLGSLPTFVGVSAAIPLFWSTRAVSDWVGGAPYLAAAFGAGQVAFVALLVYAAGVLRRRYWVPSPTEVELIAPPAHLGHPFLQSLGLSPAEAAIVSKDLRGFVRRREMLPTLVVPIVLVALLAVEGRSIGGFGSVLWVGWVAGFFALLLAVTSLGQERRSLQYLYAYPITGRDVLRAKAASVLLLSMVGALGMSVAVSVLFFLPVLPALGFVVVSATGAVVLTLWGLVFAARFSDFQDRPRPQYLRPGAMLVAMFSGMIVLFAILLPAMYAVLLPSSSSPGLAVDAVATALLAGGLAFHWARTGFDRLFREVPF